MKRKMNNQRGLFFLFFFCANTVRFLYCLFLIVFVFEKSNYNNSNDDEKDNGNKKIDDIDDEKEFTFKIGNRQEMELFINQLLNKNDIRWTLSILKIVGLKQLNNSGNHNAGDKAIESFKGHVKDLCQQSLKRIKGFEDNSGGKNESYILIQCKKNASFAKKTLEMLIDEIKENNINYCVSIGITSIFKNNNDTKAYQIINRAIQSLDTATNKIEMKTSNNNNNIYNNNNSDSNIIDYSNESIIEWNEFDYQQFCSHLKEGKNIFLNVVTNGIKIKQKQEYKKKLVSIADTENKNWVLAAMDGDNFGNIKKQSSLAIQYAIYVFACQVQYMEDKYNGVCFAFQRGGDEFSLFINTGNNNNSKSSKNIVEDIMNELMLNISKNGRFTISCGLTYLQEDEFGKQWENRAEKGLKLAKQNGKNQFCWID